MQSQRSLYERGRGNLTQMIRQCEHGGSDGSHVATSRGVLAATRSWKRQTMDSPLEQGVLPCGHLDFGPVKLILDLLVSRSVREYIFV